MRWTVVYPMRNIRVLISVLVFLITIPAWVSLVDADEIDHLIRVDGYVINGTTGARIDIGLILFLDIESGTNIDRIETSVEPDGHFVFEAVRYDPSFIYRLSTTYKNALYVTIVDVSQNDLETELTVYEPVHDISVLSVSNASVLLLQSDSLGQYIWAFEVLDISNTSNRIFIPDAKPMNLLRFGLPTDAMDLSVETVLIGDVFQVDLGFAIAANVPPGDHQLMYSYRFPYQGAETSLARSYTYGVGQLKIMIPVDIGVLQSTEMIESTRVTIGGKQYQQLATSGIDRGEKVTVDIRDLYEPSMHERLVFASRYLPYEYMPGIGLGVIMLFLIALSIYRRF